MSCLKEPCFTTDEQRWNAVKSRDLRADATFVYAVTTTRTFCRPTCSARMPKRESVVFFPSAEAALAARYRPCRRCNAASLLHQRHLLAIRRACSLVEQAEEPPSLERLARHVGLSRFYFHRLFKRCLGITPKEYVASCQIRRLRDSLRRGAPIIDAIFDAGFNSTSRIYEKTARELGMTPARFKAGASGVRMRYVVTGSPLGLLLVAVTDKGVCSVDLGGSAAELKARLLARFPGAVAIEAEAELKRIITKSIRVISAPQSSFDLPPDIIGIAFQRRVWKALQRIQFDSSTGCAAIGPTLSRSRVAGVVAQACGVERARLQTPEVMQAPPASLKVGRVQSKNESCVKRGAPTRRARSTYL